MHLSVKLCVYPMITFKLCKKGYREKLWREVNRLPKEEVN